MLKTVKLIENIAATWQGEGNSSGYRMVLLRFKYCNRVCPFCDTLVKMRIFAESEHSIDSIQESIFNYSAGIMITGGEPTFDPHFDQTVMLLNELTYPLANVETNGYRLPELTTNVDPKKPVHYIFSPKIFNDQDYSFAIDTSIYLLSNPNVFFKVVYEDNDLINNYLNELSSKLTIQSSEPFASSRRVWIMPEGTTKEKLIENSAKVFDVCEKYNFSFSSRNHIIYGFI
jgi:7-carboxy-7-deazaguanine synthase